MIPYERDIYVMLLKDETEKREEQIKQAKAMEQARQQRGY